MSRPNHSHSRVRMATEDSVMIHRGTLRRVAPTSWSSVSILLSTICVIGYSSWSVPFILNHLSSVMAGLVPAMTSFSLNVRKKDVDARDKRGHDAGEVIRLHRIWSLQ